MSPETVSALIALSRRLDLAPGPGGSRMTPVGTDKLPEAFADWPIRRAQVVALYPSSQLVAHCDPPPHGTRHHIPLEVNTHCWVFHTGTWQQLEVGTVYQMDPTELHGAVNWGTTRRTHLIVDTV